METQVIVAECPSVVAEARGSRAKGVSASARLVLIGGTSIVIGILWDISWHRTIGRDTFWTPAHMAIYFGGLLGGLICGWLVLRTTFFATAEEQAGGGGVWGVRPPLAAGGKSCGSLGTLTSPAIANMAHT